MSAPNAQSPLTTGRSQTDYDIVCPEGGIAAALEPFLEGAHSIDLVISARRGHTVRIRLYPNRPTAHRDGAVWFIWGATCYQLDASGDQIEPARKCTARFNTEVTQTQLEAGKIGILFQEGEDPL